MNAIIGDNGIITRAQEASVMSRFSSYDEELKINTIEDNGVYASGDKIKNYIPNMEDKDLENFIIISSKLLYIGKNELEMQVAEKLRLGGGSDVSDIKTVVEEVQQIVDNVVNVSDENKGKIPLGDEDKLEELEKLKEEGKEQNINDEEGLIGIRLFSRNSLNMNNGNWNILIEYNSSNKETARYGTGYYWLKKGTTYTINGKDIEFKNDYVINYREKGYYVLSQRAVNWNENATLGVPDDIAINLDPMCLANGEWIDKNFIDQKTGEKYEDFIIKNSNSEEINTGIRKTGDVEYDKATKSLLFNESEENASGEGGKIALVDTIADLSNGFTFEFYGNMSRGPYQSSKQPDGPGRMGFFCQTNSLNLVNPATKVRFFFDNDGNVLDASGKKVKQDNYDYIFKPDSTHVKIKNFKEFSDYGFSVGKDFYLTVSFVTEDDQDSIMESGDWARIDYYVDGERLGYCYHDKVQFVSDMRAAKEAKYYIVLGGTIVYDPIDMYYYKGRCYGCKLYEKGLNSEQVKLNYDMTLKYRDSFKDE